MTIFLTLGSMNKLTAQSNTGNSLAQIADTFLGTWVGEVDSPEIGKFTTELTFEWTFKNKFLKATNVLVSGGQRNLYAEVTYGWHPVLNKVIFWSFDKDGGINEGEATLEGDTLRHEWRSFMGTGEIRDMQSRLTRVSQDRATLTMLEPEAGKWVEAYTIRYKRIKKSK
jgi:hypothetical protein